MYVVVVTVETVIVTKQVNKKAFGALFSHQKARNHFGNMMRTRADKKRFFNLLKAANLFTPPHRAALAQY
jgi:hypothetical protein